MEELQRRHRSEQKDLQARVTQKKKSATKKTRKGVNDECAILELQLKEKHQAELANLIPENGPKDINDLEPMVHSEEASTGQNPSTRIGDSTPHLPVSFDLRSPADALIKKQNRQKARLARRAAEQEAATEQAAKEAENVPDLRAKESEAMQREYTERGLKEHSIRSDGHCLYAAVADQLTDNSLGLLPKISINGLDLGNLVLKEAYKATRQVAASYIAANPEEFVPFLEEPLELYIQRIKDTGEWGGHLELLALARAYTVDINVLQGNGKVETIDCGSTVSDPIWLAYYRHIYGLGEHYNSLRRVSR